MKGFDDNCAASHVDNDIILELKDSLKHLQVQKCPKSPRSPKGEKKCGRPANPIPRHKRDSHIKAEHKRRDKIQKGFETLRTLVPELEDAPAKESKAVMLLKTAEHCRKLKGDSKALSNQEAELRNEITALGNQIHELQLQLPVAGIDEVEKPPSNMEDMYNNYVQSRMQKHWKFWLFEVLIRPLFGSFKTMVTTNTSDEFHKTVSDWVKEKLALPSLRRGFVVALMNISNTTCILDNPSELQKQILQKVANIQVKTSPQISKIDQKLDIQGSSVDPILEDTIPVATAKDDVHIKRKINTEWIEDEKLPWTDMDKNGITWPLSEDSMPVLTQNDISMITDSATFSPITSSVDVISSHADVEMSDSFLQALSYPDYSVPFDNNSDSNITFLTGFDSLLSIPSSSVPNNAMFTTMAGQGHFHTSSQVQNTAQTILSTEVKPKTLFDNSNL